MGPGVDIRIDAQRHRCMHAKLAGDMVKALQFGCGLDVETTNADLECALHLVSLLADTGKHNLGGIAAGCQHPLQFTDRDDVEARAQTCQCVEHAEVRIGLYREADQVRPIAERVVKGMPVALEGGARVDVARRAELLGDDAQWYVFCIELAVAVLEVVHGWLVGLLGPGILLRRVGRWQVQRAFVAATQGQKQRQRAAECCKALNHTRLRRMTNAQV